MNAKILKYKVLQANSIAQQIKIISNTELIQNNGASPLGGLHFSVLDPVETIAVLLIRKPYPHAVLSCSGSPRRTRGVTSTRLDPCVHHLKQ